METNPTQKAVLYINQQGLEITHASYSARSDFSFCGKKFELGRVKGYTEKEKRASTWFGRAVEEAVQWHVERGYRGGPERFLEIWDGMKLIEGFDKLTYTDADGDFDQLRKGGHEMLRLFALRVRLWPFPIQTRFQVSLVRELWPNTELAGITNKARIDALSLVPGNHPALPKIENPPAETYVITDIKTAGKAIPSLLVKLDKQLREYVWGANASFGAFLWFEKKGHTMKKGDRVATLVDVQGRVLYNAGRNLTVCFFDSKNNQVFAVVSAEGFERYQKAVQDLSGKALEAAKLYFITTDDDAVVVTPDQITKQRVDFAAAYFTKEDLIEIGRSVSQETMQMIHAHRTGFYPMTGGVRFPMEKCNTCCMRGICAGNEELKNELVVISGEEWLDDVDLGE